MCPSSKGGRGGEKCSSNECYERAREKEVQRATTTTKKCVQFTYRASVIRWPCVRLMESGIESISPHMHTIIRPIQMSANPICNDPGTRKILALFVLKKKSQYAETLHRTHFVMCEWCVVVFSCSRRSLSIDFARKRII